MVIRKDILFTVLRIILGLVFVTSGVMKLISITAFELYVYELGFLNQIFTQLAVRLLISLELFMGVCFVFKYLYKWMLKLGLLIMMMFTLFLVFQYFIKPQENCHCFGEMVKMNPLESILKNIVIILLMVVLWKKQTITFKWFNYKWVILLFGLISFGYPMYYSTPSALFHASPVLPEKLTDPVYVKNFHAILDRAGIKDLNKGKKVVCVFSTGCKHCRNAAKLVRLIESKIEIQLPVEYIFFGNEENINKFWQESGVPSSPAVFVSPIEAMYLTEGHFPTVYFIEEGKFISRMGFMDLNEKVFKRFLKK